MAARALSNQAKGNRRGAWIGVVFGLVFAGAGVAMLVFMLVLPMQRMLEARSWPSVPCTVVSSGVTTHTDSDGTTYGVEIEYRYEVDGRSYTADRRSFGVDGSSSGRSGKERFVADHPPGKQLTCFVDPDDPTEAVLNKGWSASLLWGLFPLPFLLIGLLVLWFSGRTLLGLGKEAGASPMSAGIDADDGAVPSADPNTTGPVTLRPGKQRVGGAIGLLVFALIWNGIVGVFVVHLVRSALRGNVDVCTSLFMVPFVLVGVVVLGAWVQKVLLIFAPAVVLELDRGAVPVGGSVSLKWRVVSRLGRLSSMSIDLVGEERATYRRGTDTITDTHTFYEERVVGAEPGDSAFDTLRAMPDRGSVVVAVPAETMHTFKADNNAIAWKLKVHGTVRRWPDPEDSYELTVLPMALGD